MAEAEHKEILEQKILEQQKHSLEKPSEHKKRQTLRYQQMIMVLIILTIFVSFGLLLLHSIRRYEEGIDMLSKDLTEKNDASESVTETFIEENWEVSEETYYSAIDDFTAARYELAAAKLECLREAGWDGFAVWQYLADSYYEMGNVDLAAQRIAEYLQDYYGLADVLEQNVLYQRLKTWEPFLLAEARSEITPVLEKADAFAAKYKEIRVLRTSSGGDGSYDKAYKLANELRLDGADSLPFLSAYFDTATMDGNGEMLYEYLEPFLYEKESLTGRTMSYSERRMLLRCAVEWWGAEGDVLLDELDARAEEFDGFVYRAADIDPLTGTDIHGWNRSIPEEEAVEAASERMEFLRRSNRKEIYMPYLFDGREVYVIDSSIFSNGKEYTQKSYLDIVENRLFMLPIVTDNEGLLITYFFELDDQLPSDVSFLNRSYRNTEYPYMEIEIRNARRIDDQTIDLDIKVVSYDFNETIIPWRNCRFEDGRFLIEDVLWDAELFLGEEGIMACTLNASTISSEADGFYQ